MSIRYICRRGYIRWWNRLCALNISLHKIKVLRNLNAKNKPLKSFLRHFYILINKLLVCKNIISDVFNNIICFHVLIPYQFFLLIMFYYSFFILILYYFFILFSIFLYIWLFLLIINQIFRLFSLFLIFLIIPPYSVDF